MNADPNLVPYRPEWDDNIGGMANAIFWLEKNWKSGLNAQGERQMPDGSRWFWNYSPSTRLLMVELPGTKKSYEITLEKIVEITDRNREMATYYRPFFEARAYGMNTHDTGGQPIVTWLVTRRVEIVKDHHPNHTPLYLSEALLNLTHRLRHKPCPGISNIKLDGILTVPRKSHAGQTLSDVQVKAYAALVGHLNMLATVDHPFEEHHMYSYRALVTFIQQVNFTFESEASHEVPDPSYGLTPRIRECLNDEMNRLVKLGLSRSAAIVDAISFNRTFEESWEKTLAMVNALGGAAKLQGEQIAREEQGGKGDV